MRAVPSAGVVLSAKAMYGVLSGYLDPVSLVNSALVLVLSLVTFTVIYLLMNKVFRVR